MWWIPYKFFLKLNMTASLHSSPSQSPSSWPSHQPRSRPSNHPASSPDANVNPNRQQQQQEDWKRKQFIQNVSWLASSRVFFLSYLDGVLIGEPMHPWGHMSVHQQFIQNISWLCCNQEILAVDASSSACWCKEFGSDGFHLISSKFWRRKHTL